MFKKIAYTSMILIAIFASIGSAKAKCLIMEVHSQKVDCQGVGPMKCMQVKFKKSKDWENFYSQIEGFNYEEGYHYKLRVKRTKIKNPPADGSSYRYVLSKVLQKTQVKTPNRSQEDFLTSHRWKLIQFKGSEMNLHRAFIQFDATKKLANGNTSCNNFFGEFAINENKISFKKMATTRMACLNENIENDFLKMLNSKNLTYDIADQTFNIYDQGKLVAIFGLDQSTN